MKKKVFDFPRVEPWPGVKLNDWHDWQWQHKNSLTTADDFAKKINLSASEHEGFAQGEKLFRVRTTPYYASLIHTEDTRCSLRKMTLPTSNEVNPGRQAQFDPLGEHKKSNRKTERLIHRYTDRALFLVTDMCGIYCRYCTRKNFTATDQVMANKEQLAEAVHYVKEHPEIKEIIFSGGDPLTLNNNRLAHFMEAFYGIAHVELIRLGSRMPVVNPMRIDQELLDLCREFKPIYLMTHFNHPDEITQDSAQALENFVDHGVPVFNQMVLLNGVNNHPALVYALSRRLLHLRVKPHYMFQADPSLGTDHLRNSIEDSLNIQRQLWGHTSGLAMPQYIVDIPNGGGKTALSPNFQVAQQNSTRSFKGWDGIEADYISPKAQDIKPPQVSEKYHLEWNQP